MDSKDVTPQPQPTTAAAKANDDADAVPPDEHKTVSKEHSPMLEESQKLEALEPASKEELLEASQKLQSLVPDDYHAWKMQADLLLKAIHQLETRMIEPDESVKVIGVPLRESALREAAEEALRNCAHFADTFDERIHLVDEANRVRRPTWF